MLLDGTQKVSKSRGVTTGLKDSRKSAIFVRAVVEIPALDWRIAFDHNEVAALRHSQRGRLLESSWSGAMAFSPPVPVAALQRLHRHHFHHIASRVRFVVATNVATA